MTFFLFGRDEKLIKVIDLIRAIETEEINAEFGFFGVAEYDADIAEGCFIGYGNFKMYEITTIEAISGESKQIEFYARHVSQELESDYIEDLRPTGSAETVLTAILNGTRWSVGTVNDLGSTQVRFYNESVYSGIAKVANTFKGELQFRLTFSGNTITGRYVDLLQQRGSSTGKRFEYDKDIEEIIRKADMDSLITACYGYGKGEVLDGEDGNTTFGRRIDFADVVWTTPTNPEMKPLGDKYIVDSTAYTLWGRDGRNRFGKVEFDNIEDETELLEATWDYLQANNTPRMTYKLDVMLLSSLAGYEHEQVSLGDTVIVIDKEIDLKVSARVLRLQNDLLQPENSRCVLSNIVDRLTGTFNNTLQIVNRFRDKQGAYDDGATRSLDGLDASGYVALPVQGGRITSDDKVDGLNFNNTYMGYYNLAQDAWRAYIDNQGRFLFQRDANSYFIYDGTEFKFVGEVSVTGVSNVEGVLNVDGEIIATAQIQKGLSVLGSQLTQGSISTADGSETSSTTRGRTAFIPVKNGATVTWNLLNNFEAQVFAYTNAQSFYTYTPSLNPSPSGSLNITQDGFIRVVFERSDDALFSVWQSSFNEVIENVLVDISAYMSPFKGFVIEENEVEIFSSLVQPRIVITSFLNSWIAGAFPYPAPSFYKDRDRVFLKGGVRNGTNGTPAFTLPVGYRPSTVERFPITASSNLTSNKIVTIETNGNVSVFSADDITTPTMILSPISFRVK